MIQCKGQSASYTDTAITTIKTGNWSDPTIWSGSLVPGINDSVLLAHNVIVDVNTTCKALYLSGKNLTINPGVNFNIAGYKPVLNNNLLVIDSSKLKFISTTGEQAAGNYKYLVTGQIPTVKVGDAIVSDLGEGYIRKVTSTSINGNVLQLNTTQGDMEDLFKKAHFGYGVDISDLQNNATTGGKPANKPASIQGKDYQFSVAPRSLVAAGPFSINLTNADFTLSPNLNFDFDYGFTGINSFEVSCKNAQLNGVVGLNLSAQGKIDGSRTDTIHRAGKTLTVFVYGLPVRMKMDFFLIATTSYSVDAAIEKSITYTTNNSFNMTAKYQDGAWQNSFNTTSSTNTLDFGETNGKAKVRVQLNLKPLFKMRFYSVVAPYIFLDVKQSITGAVESPALNWDFLFKGWAEPGIGVEFKIFGKKLANDFGPKSWSTDTFKYRTPFKLLKEAGDLQVSSDTSNYLPKTIKVKVLDELNAAQSNVPVFFKLQQKGKLSVDTILSDANGFAETQWRIDTAKTQLLEVSVKNGSGANITNSPVNFTANYGTNPIVGNWRITGFLLFGTDVFDESPACTKDNIETFEANKSYVFDEGPKKCKPEEPQTSVGIYSLGQNNTQLTIINGGITETYFIRKLDATTLEIENINPDKGEYFIYTRQP